MPNPLLPKPASQRADAQKVRILSDLGLCAGAEFLHGDTRVRLERVDQDDNVDLRSQRTNSLLSVRNPDGSVGRTTVEWMRTEYGAGRLTAIGPIPEGAGERQRRFLLLDETIASLKDDKAKWRMSLSWRASIDAVKSTDGACEDWLDAHYGHVKGDFAHPRPSGSSLRRWIRRLAKGENRIGSLVSQAGRPRNRSQLEPEVDAAVTQAALYFYSGAGISQVMAESFMGDLITALNASLPSGRIIPYKDPSRQTLRLRIMKLECYETWARKHGAKAADRKYRGAGEPMLVDHVLELGLMDATQLEQIVVFDEDWQIPALKLRIVALMDVVSHAIFGWNMYPGPNRAEATAQAFLHCMETDKFPERMVELYPALKLVFGRFAAVLPDNEKALIGPETIAGYNAAGTTVIPAPVEMPTAKAALERFFRTLKESLAQLPGTLIDPRRATEFGFAEASAAAELTMHQLRAIVSQVIAQHNVSPSKGLQGRSPIEVLASRVATRATPAFEDTSPVRAALARSFRVEITRNGVEKDGIRYRDASAIDRILDNNKGRLGASGKSNGFEMTARRNDGDIDKLEVYDEEDGVWVPLRSTQPAYTAGLSFWEHQQYTLAAKRRREDFGSERAKLASKSETRRQIEEMLPTAAFRRKSAMTSLALASQVQKLNGGPIVLPEGVEVAPQGTADAHVPRPDRTDRRPGVGFDPKKVGQAKGPAGSEDADGTDWDDADFQGDE